MKVIFEDVKAFGVLFSVGDEVLLDVNVVCLNCGEYLLGFLGEFLSCLGEENDFEYVKFCSSCFCGKETDEYLFHGALAVTYLAYLFDFVLSRFFESVEYEGDIVKFICPVCDKLVEIKEDGLLYVGIEHSCLKMFINSLDSLRSFYDYSVLNSEVVYG